MSITLANILPNVSLKTSHCKICGNETAFYGTLDFNRSCQERNGFRLPDSHVPIDYHRCSRCQFIYTNAFDHWDEQDFKEHIYNARYIEVDPDYNGGRTDFDCERICKLFPNNHNIDVLDYGGGEGFLASRLVQAGFASAVTYDPFVSRYSKPPERPYKLVTCFETFEHFPDPLLGIENVARHIDDEGLIVFSTLIQSEFSEIDGINWWYIAPRNGHISIFSKTSLATAWKRYGFNFGSFDNNLHAAWRKLPAFARHIL